MQFLSSQLPTYLVDLVRLSLWLTILVAIFVPLERLFTVHPQRILRKGIWLDLTYFFLNGLLPALLLSAPVGFLALAVHRLLPDHFLAITAAWPFWARLLAGMVVGEIGYYWGHRWSHEFPFLWRFHSIHHSAEEVDFLVSSRSHPIDMVFGRFCGIVPIYVLGLGGPAGAAGSGIPILVTLISLMWGFFIHANLRWRFGPLEWLVSTPAFHHWHHTKTGPINRNYSSTLPWLDWIFGTLHLPRKEWPAAYGIEEKLPDSVLGQLAYPMRADPPVPSQPAVAATTAVSQEIQPTVETQPASPQPPRAETPTDLVAQSR